LPDQDFSFLAHSAVREGSAALVVGQFEPVTRFSRRPEAAKLTVYRKALFRDRNRTTFLTWSDHQMALRGVFQPLKQREFTLNA
jgi:hypothetical protein